MPTFKRMDVTSYAVDSDGRTILASTAAATFAFDPLHHEWKKRVEWSLPFSGRANFVHGLDVFVGLPKDVDAFGHLCFCRWLGDDKHVWFSKENLSSEDPEAESHVGTTYTSLLGRKQVLPCGVRQQWGCQSCAEVAGGVGRAGSDREVGRLPPKLTLSFDDILSQL
jgi:hypothetical protein